MRLTPEEETALLPQPETTPVAPAEEEVVAAAPEQVVPAEEVVAAAPAAPKAEPAKTNEEQIAILRAEEQAELDSRIKGADKYRGEDGKVDKTKLTKKADIKAFNEVYDKYDKLISPLMETKPAEEKKREKVKDAFSIAKKLSPDSKVIGGGLGAKAANYTTKDGIEISLKDDDFGELNGEQVQADFQIDYIGNEKGQRGAGLASKELDRILEEADKNDLSVSLNVDSEGATTNVVGDKQGNIGLSNEKLKNWYKKRGFIFDKDSNYGYRPKKSEGVSKYKIDTYQAKKNEIQVDKNLEGLSSPKDLRELYQEGRLEEGMFYEDGDKSIYTVKDGKLKLVDNVDYDYRYEKDKNGNSIFIEEVKIKAEAPTTTTTQAEFTSKQESSASTEFDGTKKPSKIKTKSFDGKHGKGAFERMKNITDNFEDIMDGLSEKIKQDCL